MVNLQVQTYDESLMRVADHRKKQMELGQGQFLSFAFMFYIHPEFRGPLGIDIHSTNIFGTENGDRSQRELWENVMKSLRAGDYDRRLGKMAGVDKAYVESLKIHSTDDRTYGVSDDRVFTMVSLGENCIPEGPWAHALDKEGLRLLKQVGKTPAWVTANYDF